MKQRLQLRLSQHLALTPQLQQSIRLLQLSTLELNQEIEQALQENPLLEREEPVEITGLLFTPMLDARCEQQPVESDERPTTRPTTGRSSAGAARCPVDTALAILTTIRHRRRRYPGGRHRAARAPQQPAGPDATRRT